MNDPITNRLDTLLLNVEVPFTRKILLKNAFNALSETERAQLVSFLEEDSALIAASAAFLENLTTVSSYADAEKLIRSALTKLSN